MSKLLIVTNAQAIALAASCLNASIRDAEPIKVCVHARRTYDGDGMDVSHEGFVSWSRPDDRLPGGTEHGTHYIVIRCSHRTANVPEPKVVSGEYMKTQEWAKKEYDRYAATRPVDAEARFYYGDPVFHPDRRSK